jgi:hypothetical protein
MTEPWLICCSPEPICSILNRLVYCQKKDDRVDNRSSKPNESWENRMFCPKAKWDKKYLPKLLWVLVKTQSIDLVRGIIITGDGVVQLKGGGYGTAKVNRYLDLEHFLFQKRMLYVRIPGANPYAAVQICATQRDKRTPRRTLLFSNRQYTRRIRITVFLI